MRNSNNLSTALSTVLGVTFGFLTTTHAHDLPHAHVHSQPVGMARISDRTRPAPVPATAAESAAANPSTATDSSTCSDCDDYQHADCQHANCRHAIGHGTLLGNNGPPRSPLEAMLRHQGTVSPDDGWARPVRKPIRRNPVEYRRYWPSKWWGQPGSALSARRPAFPQVYRPTDTTQLGYYYQSTPQWRPNPAMVPPMPWPSAWHRRECPAFRSGQYGIPAGAVIESTSPTPAH